MCIGIVKSQQCKKEKLANVRCEKKKKNARIATFHAGLINVIDAIKVARNFR